MPRLILFYLMLFFSTTSNSFADTSKILQQAESGDAKSQVAVGLWYMHGRSDREQSCDLAKEWFLKSARQGYAGAAMHLYSLYSGASIFCEENKGQAKEWLIFAAGTGDANFQWTLGQAYRDGWYDEVDANKALFWFRRAADQGYEFAERDIKKLLLNSDK